MFRSRHEDESMQFIEFLRMTAERLHMPGYISKQSRSLLPFPPEKQISHLFFHSINALIIIIRTFLQGSLSPFPLPPPDQSLLQMNVPHLHSVPFSFAPDGPSGLSTFKSAK